MKHDFTAEKVSLIAKVRDSGSSGALRTCSVNFPARLSNVDAMHSLLNESRKHSLWDRLSLFSHTWACIIHLSWKLSNDIAIILVQVSLLFGRLTFAIVERIKRYSDWIGIRCNGKWSTSQSIASSLTQLLSDSPGTQFRCIEHDDAFRSDKARSGVNLRVVDLNVTFQSEKYQFFFLTKFLRLVFEFVDWNIAWKSVSVQRFGIVIWYKRKRDV